MKGAGHNSSAESIGTAVRTVSKGGYIGALANKFYAGYRRNGEQITVVWDATSVTLLDAGGATIAQYAKSTNRGGWHGPLQGAPSSKS